MPLKYKPLIPLLEGEQLDYTNQARIEDDVLANGISYFNASTFLFGTENEAYCKVNNVAKAKSCYELTSKGINSDDPMTCGVLVLKNVESSTINITKCVAGRYECRVLLPKENGTTFCIKLLGQYGNQDYAFIQMQTPFEITNSEADINNCIEISARVRNGTSKHKEVQITKNLNDSNFHTLGFDWYCSTNNKKINFYIDNTFIGSIDGDNVPNTPMKLYIGAYPSNNLPLSNYFDTDYVLIDYIRYIPFVNQEGMTDVALVEDTKVGEITLTSTRDYPRIINTKNSNNELQVVSTFKKDSTGKIVSKLNTNGNNWTLDTNGNRDAYEYGTYSATVESKINVPSVVEATINGKKANYPVIQSNARARLKKIEGNSIVWNQLCPNFKETINGTLRQCWYQDGGKMTITEENGEQVATLMANDPTGVTFRLRPYTISVDGTSNQDLMRNLPPRYHKILFKFDARAEGTDTYDWGNWVLYICNYDVNNPKFSNTMKSGEWTTFTYIQEMTLSDMISCFFNPSYSWTSGLTDKNIGYSMRRVMVFDLTLMFGKGNEPTIEEFNRMFPEVYYAWTPDGEIRTTQIKSIKSYSSDGTELDSINLPSEVLNKDYISSSLNSQYHNGFQVTNRLKLDNYKYDGADFLGIEEFTKVKSINLGNYTWSKSSTYNFYSFYDSGLNSAAKNSDQSYWSTSCILCPVLSSTTPQNLDSSTSTNYNKAIAFGGNANSIHLNDSQYADAAALKTGLTGVNAYIGMSTATQYNNDVTNYLYFDDISLQIAEGGYIEVDYTGVQPNISFDFPVQLYRIYEASYGKVDIVALDSQLQTAKYNTSLQLNNVKGRSVKWTQLVNPTLFKDTQTVSGVTFTFNKTNGTITCNGTATEDIYFSLCLSSVLANWLPTDYFYLKGCPSGGSDTTYYLRWGNLGVKDIGSGVYKKVNEQDGSLKDTTNIALNPSIVIKNGVTMTNKVFRPQLFNVSNIYGLGKEPSTIADFNKDYPYSIYPYGKQEILTTKVSGIKIRAGYKNWIDKNDLRTDNVTINGVALKNNGDGTFTLNGAATADTVFGIYKGGVDAWKKMTSVNTQNIKILYQGCPKGGSLNTYYTTNYFGYNDIGNGVIVTVGPNTTSNLKLNTSMIIHVKQGTVCNNLVFKPQIINLTDTYGIGNEPKTVAQFNQDFPDIDNIPYPEQEITFDEQTLYGINDVQDTLQVVKENDGYKLDLIHNITSIDMGNMNYNEWRYQGNNLGWVIYSGSGGNTFYTSSALGKLPSNLITKEFITVPRVNIDVNNYNKTICMADGTMYLINKDVTTGAEFKESVKGQILYGATKIPTTTTLATLTKSQVTALFAKGYCVEILGNDDNRVIVRPDLVIKYNGEVEEIVTQSDDASSEVVE